MDFLQQESNEPVLSKLPLKHPWMAFGMGVPAQRRYKYQPSLQRPGPVLVAAAAEPAIELLFESSRHQDALAAFDGALLGGQIRGSWWTRQGGTWTLLGQTPAGTLKRREIGGGGNVH